MLEYSLQILFLETRLVLAVYFCFILLRRVGFVESILKALFITGFSLATNLPTELKDFEYIYDTTDGRDVIVLHGLKICSPPLDIDPRWRNDHIVHFHRVTIVCNLATSLWVFVVSGFSMITFYCAHIDKLEYFLEGYRDENSDQMVINLQLIGADSDDDYGGDNSGSDIIDAKEIVNKIAKKCYSVFDVMQKRASRLSHKFRNWIIEGLFAAESLQSKNGNVENININVHMHHEDDRIPSISSTNTQARNSSDVFLGSERSVVTNSAARSVPMCRQNSDLCYASFSSVLISKTTFFMRRILPISLRGLEKRPWKIGAIKVTGKTFTGSDLNDDLEIPVSRSNSELFDNSHNIEHGITRSGSMVSHDAIDELLQTPPQIVSPSNSGDTRIRQTNTNLRKQLPVTAKHMSFAEFKGDFDPSYPVHAVNDSDDRDNVESTWRDVDRDNSDESDQSERQSESISDDCISGKYSGDFTCDSDENSDSEESEDAIITRVRNHGNNNRMLLLLDFQMMIHNLLITLESFFDFTTYYDSSDELSEVKKVYEKKVFQSFIKQSPDVLLNSIFSFQNTLNGTPTKEPSALDPNSTSYIARNATIRRRSVQERDDTEVSLNPLFDSESDIIESHPLFPL